MQEFEKVMWALVRPVHPLSQPGDGQLVTIYAVHQVCAVCGMWALYCPSTRMVIDYVVGGVLSSVLPACLRWLA